MEDKYRVILDESKSKSYTFPDGEKCVAGRPLTRTEDKLEKYKEVGCFTIELLVRAVVDKPRKPKSSEKDPMESGAEVESAVDVTEGSDEEPASDDEPALDKEPASSDESDEGSDDEAKESLNVSSVLGGAKPTSRVARKASSNRKNK